MDLALGSTSFRLFAVKFRNRKQKNDHKFIKYIEHCCTFKYKLYTPFPLMLLS